MFLGCESDKKRIETQNKQPAYVKTTPCAFYPDYIHTYNFRIGALTLLHVLCLNTPTGNKFDVSSIDKN